MDAAEALDARIAVLASTAQSAAELLTLCKAYAKLADATEDTPDEKDVDPHIEHPIHQTNMIESLDVGTSFWSSDGLRAGFRPGGYDGSRT